MYISFIIPAYNATNTIIRCLDSIYSLSFPKTDFEVIVIDDCSLDDTADLIENYARSQVNLTLLRQIENHRQGAARNRGLGVAKGEYIAFVDSDDTVEAGIVKALSMAMQLDLDMVAMLYGRVSCKGEITYAKNLNYSENEMFSGKAFQEKNKYWCSGPCGYLYSRNFLQSVSYPFAEDVLYEDADFVMNHLYQAKRMAFCPECSYLACYNSQSTTHSMSYKHVADYMSLGVRQLVFYQRMESKESSFAQDILEGGVWNVNKACKHLWRLNSWKEVREFYRRIDAKCHRDFLMQQVFYPFKLSLNSRMTIKHRISFELMALVLLPVFRVLHKLS